MANIHYLDSSPTKLEMGIDLEKPDQGISNYLKQ